MKKNFYKGLMTLCFCSVVFTTNVMAQDESPFAGGTGTPDDPYLIATPQQFDRMRDARGASYKLIADLDFSNVHFDYEGGGPLVNGVVVLVLQIAFMVLLTVMGIQLRISM